MSNISLSHSPPLPHTHSLSLTHTHTHTQRNQLHTSRHLKIIYLLIFTEILNCSQFTWHKDALMSQTALKHTHTHAHTHTHTQRNQLHTSRHLKIIYLLIFTEILNCRQCSHDIKMHSWVKRLSNTHTRTRTHTHRETSSTRHVI